MLSIRAQRRRKNTQGFGRNAAGPGDCRLERACDLHVCTCALSANFEGKTTSIQIRYLMGLPKVNFALKTFISVP